MKQILFTFLFLVLTFFSIVFTFEISLRLFGPSFHDHIFVTKYSPRYHHLDYEAEQTLLKIKFNHFSNSNLKKILIIGDSFINAEEVPYESRAVVLLSEKLNKVFPNEFEVISLGQGSWSTMIYSRALEDSLKTLKPDLIFIALDQSDLVDDFVYTRDLEAGEGSDFVNTVIHRLEKSYVSKFLIYSKALLTFDLFTMNYFSFSFFFPWLPQLMKDRHYERVSRQAVISNSPESVDSYFSITSKYLLDMDQMVPENSHLYFITFPRSDHLSKQKKSSYFEGFIDENNETFPYMDYWIRRTQFDKLFQNSTYLPTYERFKDIQDNGPLFFWDQDVHWNEKGNEIFFEILFETVVDHFGMDNKA